MVPVSASRLVAEQLDTALELVDGVGHLPMDERPEALAEELLKFIKQKS